MRLNQLLRMVGVSGEHGDVAHDAVALDAHDVDRADVAADTPDR